LGQNYPNPFNPSTTIEYGLKSRSEVSIGIYNVNGQLIRVLVSESKPAGIYSIEWDGRDQRGTPVASGVYLSRMRAGAYLETKKLLLLK
jgi:flagellar hook assembly protein FlgD